MKTTFDEIIEIVLEHEGGYVNDPHDRGGETKYGISKRAHNDVNIKTLTVENAPPAEVWCLISISLKSVPKAIIVLLIISW